MMSQCVRSCVNSIDNYMMQTLMYRLVACHNRLNSLLVTKNTVNNITGTRKVRWD